MKKFTPIASLALVLLITTPLISFAALDGIKGLIKDVGDIIKQLIIIAGGVALLGFFWGLAKFIFGAGDPKNREQGKNIMIWGILALFVMMSVFGIINFFQDSFGLPRSNGVNNGSVLPGTSLPSSTFGDTRST